MARQDLDEALARKARVLAGANTFYSGESGTPYYFWQPETLSWTDTNYNSEVWRVAWKPLGIDIYSKEYSTETWSADGSKIGFFDFGGVRLSSDPNRDVEGSGKERWILNTDGTKLRAGTGRGYGIDNTGFGWLHTEPSSYLFFPSATGEFSGANIDRLYGVAVDSNNDMSRTLLLDIADGYRKYLTIKDSITSTDAWVVAQDGVAANWSTPNAIDSTKVYFINLTNFSGTAGNSVTNSWGVARGIGPVADPYSNHTQANETMLRGSSSTVLNPDASGIIAHFSGEGVFTYFKKSGSYADGGPEWEDWDGDSFGTNEEIKVVSNNAHDSNIPPNPYNNGYAGHISPDRWGKYAQVGFSNDCGDGTTGQHGTNVLIWGVNSCPGRIVIDLSNNWKNPSWVDANNSNYPTAYNTYQAGHGAWNGWTDWVVAVSGTPPYDAAPGSGRLYMSLYNKTVQEGKTNYRARDTIVTTETPDSIDNYSANPRPSQSPDGTKVSYATVLFHSPYGGTAVDSNYLSIAYVVAYNPYPPEVYSVSATGGTVTVRGDWGTNSGTWRGYTQRKWVNETTGTYLPPREISKWRLWRSADKATWTPLTPATANAWDRYNFATGVWTGNTYWDLTDVPGNGTWYYAFTSIETSGLESRALGNIFAITVSDGSGTGAQDTAYPESPGTASNFYASYSGTTLTRYYNVYAADGSAPDISVDPQKKRIASISKNIGISGSFSWIDWLGDPVSPYTTQYIVTPVDTQGNEGTALGLTVTHQKSPATAVGQYTLEWSESGLVPPTNLRII